MTPRVGWQSLFALAVCWLCCVSLYPSPAAANLLSQRMGLQKAFDIKGLPTTSLLQDREGFVWLGSLSGALRFDGQRLQRYHRDNIGLSSNQVTQLFEDRRGRLWLATTEGLNRLDKVTLQVRQYRRDRGQADALADDFFPAGGQRIFQDAQERLWFANRSGLYRYREASDGFEHFQHQPEQPKSLSGNDVVAIADAPEGQLWVATRHSGLNLFDPESGRARRYLAPSDLHTMVQAENGDLWFASPELGLLKFSLAERRFTTYGVPSPSPSEPHAQGFSSITLLPDGDLLLGASARPGLVCFDPLDERFEVTLNTDRELPLSLMVDTQHSVWMAARSGVVLHWDARNQRFERYADDIMMREAKRLTPHTPLVEDQRGNLWIGRRSNSLLRKRPEDAKFVPVRLSGLGMPHRAYDIYTLSDLGDDQLLMGTELGLMLLDTQALTITRHLSDRQYIAVQPSPLSAERLWAYAEGVGLCQLSLQGGEEHCYRHPALSQSPLRVLRLEPNQKALWLLTQAGALWRFSLDKHRFVRHAWLEPQQPLPKAYDLRLDQRGHLWLATERGLYQYDPQLERARAHGDRQQSVYSLAFDQRGDLWLGSDRGLQSFDPQSESITRQYSAEQGLLSHQFVTASALTAGDGSLWFGNFPGVLHFYPEQLRRNHVLPPVYFTALRSQRRNLSEATAPEYAQEITLTWPNSSFEFEFAALNYINSGQNQYAYRLLGLEQRWMPVSGKPQGRYTELPVGTYKLQIKAANNDGVWNEVGASLNVQVQAPLWRHPSVYATLLSVAMLLLLWWLYRHQKSHQRQLARAQGFATDQAEHLARATLALKDQEKRCITAESEHQYKRMVAGITHELHYTLQSLLHPSSTSVAHGTHPNPQNIAAPLNALQRQLDSLKRVAAHQANHYVTDIHLRDQLAHILSTQNYKLRKRPLHIDNQIPEHLTLTSYPSLLFHILSCLLDNTLRHGYGLTETADILLQAKPSGEGILLVYRDHGRGLDRHSAEQLFSPYYSTSAQTGRDGLGLSVVYQLVTQGMNGDVRLCSPPDQRGFHLEMQLPHLHQQRRKSGATGQNALTRQAQ